MTQIPVAEAFNPYRQWLDLDTSSPQSDYELLGLKPFEQSAATIAAAADRAIARVRSHRPGDQAAAWSRLLDDLNNAKRRLGDAQEKSRYDEGLRSGVTPVAPAAPATTPSSPATNDFRYPPGMSPPNGNAASPAPVAATPQPTPAPVYTPAAEAPAMGTTPSPWSMPQQPAPVAYQPQPQQHQPQPQQPQPMYQPMPGQPMPGSYAPQPGMYAQPMHPLGMHPQGMQPQMPMAYAMPMHTMPQPGMYPGSAPMAAPGWYQPPAMPPPASAYPMASLAPSGLYDPMSTAAPVDPMAPIDPMAPFGQAPVATIASPYEDVAAATSAVPMGVAIGSASAPQTEAMNIGLKGPSTAQAAKNRSRSSADPVVWGGIALAAVFVIAGVWFAVNNQAGESVDVAKKQERVATQVVRKDPPPSVKPEPKPVPKPIPLPVPMPLPKPVEPAPIPEPAPMPKPPEPMPKPPEPTPIPTPEPVPPKPPEPAPTPEMPLPTKQDVAALATALSSARLALSEGNIADAKTQLEKAKSLPAMPEHKALVERMSMLVEYNDQFWKAVSEAMKTFQDGTDSELMVGNQVLAVVEGFPDKIILRIAGQNRTYALKDLPGGIAVAIADKWLDEKDPASRVVKGAYAAVNKAGNVDKARTLWDEAMAGGLDIKALMPVLDDKYDGLEKDLDKAMQARTTDKPEEEKQ